ncbi:MAG: hypothetical protein GY869_06995, partial [Planctomycetes bacterium]|nr:hypothetical protein [Planctomycetota bacterium]
SFPPEFTISPIAGIVAYQISPQRFELLDIPGLDTLTVSFSVGIDTLTWCGMSSPLNGTIQYQVQYKDLCDNVYSLPSVAGLYSAFSQATLSVIKDVPLVDVAVADTFGNKIVVELTGPFACSSEESDSISVMDIIPGDWQIVDSADGIVSGDTIRWMVHPDAAMGAWSREVRFVLPRVAGCQPSSQSFGNILKASWINCCGCAFSDSTTETTDFTCDPPVLSVSKTLPASATYTDTLTSTVTVDLTGSVICSEDTTNYITVLDVFPDVWTVIESAGGTVSNDTIFWIVHQDSAAAGWSRDLRFFYPTAGCVSASQNLTNRFYARTIDCCGCVAEDSTNATVTFDCNEPTLTVNKISPGSADYGDTITTTITVEISEPFICNSDTTDSISVWDVFPSHWTVIDSAKGTVSGDTIRWTILPDSAAASGGGWVRQLQFMIPRPTVCFDDSVEAYANRLFASTTDCCGCTVIDSIASVTGIDCDSPTLYVEKTPDVQVVALGDTFDVDIYVELDDFSVCANDTADSITVIDIYPSSWILVDPDGGIASNDTILWRVHPDSALSGSGGWSRAPQFTLPTDSCSYCNTDMTNNLEAFTTGCCNCELTASSFNNTWFECTVDSVNGNMTMGDWVGRCESLSYLVEYDFPDGMPTSGNWANVIYRNLMENNQTYAGDSITVTVVDDGGARTSDTFVLGGSLLTINFSAGLPDTSGFPAYTSVDSIIFEYNLSGTCNTVVNTLFFVRSEFTIPISAGSCFGIGSNFYEIEWAQYVSPEMTVQNLVPNPLNYCQAFEDTIVITRTSDVTAYQPEIFLPLRNYSRLYASNDSIRYEGLLADTTNMLVYGPVDTTIATIPGIFWRFNDFHADSAAVGSIIIPLRKNCDNDTYALYADLYWYDSCYTDPICMNVDRNVVGNSTINLPSPTMDLDHAAPSPINYCESFIDTITITRTSTSTAYEPNL